MTLNEFSEAVTDIALSYFSVNRPASFSELVELQDQLETETSQAIQNAVSEYEMDANFPEETSA